MLETTAQSIEQIARRAGFANAAAMRDHFQWRLQTTLTAHRKSFAGHATGLDSGGWFAHRREAS